MRKPSFLIFEGGGAKGIAHIGGLRALEEQGFSIAGVGGASAGAFIAALVAVGCKADDLFSPSGRDNNLLARKGTSPQKLLGKMSWCLFQCAKRPFVMGVISIVFGILLSIVLFPYGRSLMFLGWAAACGCALAWAALYTVMAAIVWWRGGWIDTAGVEKFLNEVLRERMVLARAQIGSTFTEEKVKFRHLVTHAVPGLTCPLKIIATDVDEQRLVLFDTHLTPDVEIAKAVAASIAIPIAFRPVMVNYLADGGRRRLAD